MNTSLINARFENAQPEISQPERLLTRMEQIQSQVKLEEVPSRVEHAESITYVSRNLRAAQAAAEPLGNGVIEFDPNADAQTEVGPIERAISTIAFVGLLIAAIYLIYLFISQHFEPMLYLATHL